MRMLGKFESCLTASLLYSINFSTVIFTYIIVIIKWTVKEIKMKYGPLIHQQHNNYIYDVWHSSFPKKSFFCPSDPHLSIPSSMKSSLLPFWKWSLSSECIPIFILITSSFCISFVFPSFPSLTYKYFENCEILCTPMFCT